MRSRTITLACVLTVTLLTCGSGCRSTRYLTHDHLARIWTLDSLLHADVEVVRRGNSQYFNEGTLRSRQSESIKYLAGIPKWQNGDSSGMVFIPVLEITRMCYDMPIEMLVTNRGMLSLNAGEWCIEYHNGVAVRIVEKKYVNDYKKGTRTLNETSYHLNDVVEVGIQEITPVSFNLSAWQIFAILSAAALIYFLSTFCPPFSPC